MPPKKASTSSASAAQQPSKKTVEKKKEKIIEDKTFGLKNKKGTKQQKFIQQVQNQVKKKPELLPNSSVAKKEEKKKQLDEINQLFRPVTTQKVEKGVDPKSVLCAFFKTGQCGKGDKCKFSHDLTLERKSEKKNVYEDVRQEDTMDDWDDEKLKQVVATKHGEREKKMPTTDIICRHFIEALETSKYGWFWDCPNGGDKCHYRHALPPGFVLNKDRKRADKKDDITIEELVEIERAKLGYDLTKITLESFLEWKRKKITEKADKEEKETDRKRAEFKAGKNVGLSGREMFTFNPELAKDEDMEEGESAYEYNNSEDEEYSEERVVYKEIDLEALAAEAKAVDGTGTQSVKREFNLPNDANEAIAAGSEDLKAVESAPIDETLFAEEDDIDLDDLDEQLNTFSIEK